MNNLQWIKLKRDFEETRCILMIGPKLARIRKEGEWVPLVEALSFYLSDFLDQEGVTYDQNSKGDLPYISQKFLNIKGARRVDLEDLTKDFYETNTPEMPEVYNLLATLPVSIIINVNPDNFIQKALREQGKQCISLHYNFHRETANSIDIEKISLENPLVYNLFGSLEETESIVLTEEDQLEFIRNVVKDDPRIPEEILSQFDHRKTYLFFGFDLENWQFRLLLDGLKLREENTTVSPKQKRYPLSETTKSFYEERFNFQFVDKEIDDFLDELRGKIGIDEKDDEPKVTQKVFLIYDEKDEEFRIGLENSLSQLQSNKDIEILYWQKFTAGTEEDEILQNLENANIILPILSPNFLADNQLNGHILELAEKQHLDGKLKVYPIVARPCDWRENDFLKKLEPVPENAEPITSSKWNTRDDAYFEIVRQLKKRLK